MSPIGTTCAIVDDMSITLKNESITFTPDGIWIQPHLSDRFRFNGSVGELINVLIAHDEINLEHARFYVRRTHDKLKPTGDAHRHKLVAESINLHRKD